MYCSKLSWFSVISLIKNIKYARDRKIIVVYVSQKLSEYREADNTIAKKEWCSLLPHMVWCGVVLILQFWKVRGCPKFSFWWKQYTKCQCSLHYVKSYLAWPKYKTAKPLLYMVYRTRNRKQLVGKWSREKVSFEAVPKNSQHWSGGDIRQQIFRLTDSHSRSRLKTVAMVPLKCNSIAASSKPPSLFHERQTTAFTNIFS